VSQLNRTAFWRILQGIREQLPRICRSSFSSHAAKPERKSICLLDFIGILSGKSAVAAISKMNHLLFFGSGLYIFY
jgi:hypothetical protein